MNGALHVATTGMSAQDTNLKLISNNLANVSTYGFKKDRAVFQDLFYETQRMPGAESGADSQLPSGLQLGNGTRVVGTQKIFSDGEFEVTGESFDFAIGGKGFFQITTPDGDTAYTRNGQFHIDSQGRIVSAEGYVLEPEITLPEQVTSFSVGNNGIVSVTIGRSEIPQDIGQIEIANFINPQGLLAVGDGLFMETAASGAPTVSIPGQDGTGEVRQGVLEGSNVNSVVELVNMITTQRAYEMNSKVISTADAMLQYATQNL